jgi:hypothetical protein
MHRVLRLIRRLTQLVARSATSPPGPAKTQAQLAEPAATEAQAVEPVARETQSVEPAATETQSAESVTRKQMAGGWRAGLWIWIVTLMVVALVHLPWVWSHTKQLIAGGARPRQANWLGITFQPTAASFLLLMVILTAMIGSATILALTLGHRAGYQKLEAGWELWYLLRPVTAIGVGVISFALLKAGLLTVGNSDSDLFAAAVIGGLSGLFTDQLLQQMSKILGLKDFKKPSDRDEEAERSGDGAPPPKQTPK